VEGARVDEVGACEGEIVGEAGAIVGAIVGTNGLESLTPFKGVGLAVGEGGDPPVFLGKPRPTPRPTPSAMTAKPIQTHIQQGDPFATSASFFAGPSSTASSAVETIPASMSDSSEADEGSGALLDCGSGETTAAEVRDFLKDVLASLSVGNVCTGVSSFLVLSEMTGFSALCERVSEAALALASAAAARLDRSGDTLVTGSGKGGDDGVLEVEFVFPAEAAVAATAAAVPATAAPATPFCK